ncbi:MAG: RNA-binding S4 domain-containing protein [Deltaproteobacteria bacterium]|jgi:ribosome-associated protein|nr:RNA-binding S4 domain-containing protein [Deltaproteobacteria bacterium]MBT4266315.1 RNA-binding S4 domain-containing protein [Deltaproteobacteria bacterium]MBT4642159.1 RNA-binding S4 domain-containing protein [Deltaproteobacteria bacterium]MBT6501535.1 RNA-binding S4 domain-containing protein [Deltaproteobacteria bacterium]MBT6616528.1 RNA-binding S4 domain-containing protein [Deltaproteobacteria bacterium]
MNDISEQQFEISGEYIELIKLLKATGICQTGGHAKIVVTDGEVKLNGEQETRKKRKIRKGDCVEFENHRIKVV